MQTFKCTVAELATPEFIRLLAIATAKENQRLQKLELVLHALSVCNRLKNSATKTRHKSRIFAAMNKARAAA